MDEQVKEVKEVQDNPSLLSSVEPKKRRVTKDLSITFFSTWQTDLTLNNSLL